MQEPARQDSTTRFSDRVDDYIRYRPDYPLQLLTWLHEQCGVTASWHVADIGAGTGISARMFLDAGHTVVAVEPNPQMRAAAERVLGNRPGFRSADGRAEATGLEDQSVDLLTAAQSFHWFDERIVRAEFARVLRPGGLVVVFWNSRRLSGSAFLEGYERLLQDYGTDYQAVAERYPDDATMCAWYGPGYRAHTRFEHRQRLDFHGLRGRLLSSSYVPPAGHPEHVPMLRALRQLFDACAVDSAVDMVYDTRIFAGTVT